jgi:hypothetical protein
MSEAPADPAMVAGWNAVSIADPSRLTVKLAWASGTPGHPSEFDVPDHRIKT